MVKLVTLRWGQKVKYHKMSVYMPNSKIFMPNYVCVVQMKDTKHIRRDFHSVTLVMPQGWDFGALGVPRGSTNIFFQTWSSGISIRRWWQAEQNACKIFILGSNWWPWGEVKRSNIIKFWLPCQFHFLYQTLHVLSQIREKIYWT